MMSSLKDRIAKSRVTTVRFGDREIVADGLRLNFWADISHRCMTASWPSFIAGAVGIFIVFNTLFGLLYWIGDNPISNVARNDYLDYLYFSIETLSTAGYGDMHPQTHYGHFIATVELFTGIFSDLNVARNDYLDYLYFSIETLSTAGYGDMHPQTHYGHFIATVELFTGIF